VKYDNFSDERLACSCCGRANPNWAFHLLMCDVVAFRYFLDKPVYVGSAYRCPDHPIEANKEQAGEHSRAAIDLSVDRSDGLECLKFFLNLGYVGVGVSQKGSKRFIHIDRRVQPALWSY